MAKKRKSSYQEFTADELSRELLELRQENANLIFQKHSGQLENPARIRIVRREVAKVLTETSARKATPAKA